MKWFERMIVFIVAFIFFFVLFRFIIPFGKNLSYQWWYEPLVIETIQKYHKDK